MIAAMNQYYKQQKDSVRENREVKMAPESPKISARMRTQKTEGVKPQEQVARAPQDDMKAVWMHLAERIGVQMPNHFEKLPAAQVDQKFSEWFDQNLDKLKKLTYLSFEATNISHVPSEIGRLENLKDLRLYHFEGSSLPDSICQLRNLERLDIQTTKITSLPKGFEALENLKTVFLPKKLYDSLSQEFKDKLGFEILWPFNTEEMRARQDAQIDQGIRNKEIQ